MFEIRFETGNAAFHDGDNPEYDKYCIARETKRILEDIADKIDYGYTEGKCVDYNGNVVGEWKLRT